jgi:hypothetical protein
MATVTERIKDTFSSAKEQLAGLEKQVEQRVEAFEKKVGDFEKRAKKSIDDVPAQLRGAWQTVVERIRQARGFVTKEELKTVSDKVEDLAQKVEKLIRGEKIRAAAEKKEKPTSKRA